MSYSPRSLLRPVFVVRRSLTGKQAFCSERAFRDGDLVTEDKLVFFLQERVLERPLRGARFRKSNTPVVRTLGVSAVNNYISAIISLYAYQHSIGQNLHAHPRGAKLKALLQSRVRRETARKKAQFFDRGVGTIQDSYEALDIQRIVRAC